MLLAAVLAFVIVTATTGIIDALAYEGPYIVAYGEDGERPEVVTRSLFLRHEIAMNGMLLAMALGMWFFAAKSAKTESEKHNAHEAYLTAQLKRSEAFQDAFSAATDETNRVVARAEAVTSLDFRLAVADEERKYYDYLRAKKEDEGPY